MSAERNHYAAPESVLQTVESKPFGMPLALALALPILIVIGAWCLQWLAKFPKGSLGASLTAVAVVLGLIAEIVPVPIAIAKLIRYPTLRRSKNLTLTIVGALFLLAGVAIVAALALGV